MIKKVLLVFFTINIFLFSSCGAATLLDTSFETNVGGNLLSAEIYYSFSKPVTVTVTNQYTGMKTFSEKKRKHNIFVLGLQFNEPTDFLIEIKDGKNIEQKQLTLAGVEPPPFLPRINLTVEDTSPSAIDDLILISELGRSYIIDQQGRIVWMNFSMLSILRRLDNGHFLAVTKKDGHSVSGPYLQEIDLAGRVYKRYYLDLTFHHDVIGMADGSIIALGNSEQVLIPKNAKPDEALKDSPLADDRFYGVSDEIYQLSDGNNITQKWNMKDYMNSDRIGFFLRGREKDWFHGNAIAYNDAQKSLSVSGRGQNAIIDIDYDSGELNWIMASATNPTPLSEEDKKNLLKISEQDIFSTSHSIGWLPNGNLLLYDNGLARQPKPYSRAVEYEIDAQKKEAKIVRQFDYGQQYFTPITGSVYALSPDTWLVFYAYLNRQNGKLQPSRLLKVNPTNGKIDWEVTISRYRKKIRPSTPYRAIPLTREWGKL